MGNRRRRAHDGRTALTRTVAIVDYGVGNLFSLMRAVERTGGRPKLVQTAHDIDSAERVILPGVGAFGACANELAQRGLADAIQSFADSGRPLLGICVGMQLFADSSEEFGHHRGLGLIRGAVRQIASHATDGTSLRIPHIGWNELAICAPVETRLFAGLTNGVDVYFVHSYSIEMEQPDSVAATCEYGGYKLHAALEQRNLYGCQFHPEKSGSTGLIILGNFLRCA